MNMRLHPHSPTVAAASIPLLDASSLPSSDDWALLDSINAYADDAGDFEDSDRFGRLRLSTAYDE